MSLAKILETAVSGDKNLLNHKLLLSPDMSLEGRSSVVELLVATVRVPGLSPTKKLVHAKWIAFAICLFLNDLYYWQAKA